MLIVLYQGRYEHVNLDEKKEKRGNDLLTIVYLHIYRDGERAYIEKLEEPKI
jgi:hypothetical protein